MRNTIQATVGIWAVMAAAASVLAAPPANAPAAAQLQAWLEQLDDDNYSRREEATVRLHAAGERAIDALAEGALSGSPEVAWRAGEALKRIAVSGDERTIDRVAAALERVGKQGRSGVVQVVSEIRVRQKQLRHDRAAEHIRRLGGGLSGGMAGFGGEMVVDVGFMPVAMPAVVEVEVFAERERAVEEAAAAADEAGRAAAEAGAAAAAAADEAAKVAAIAAEVATKAVGEDKRQEVESPLPDAPPAEVKDAVKDLFPGELSLEILGGQRIEEADKPVEAREPAAEPAVEALDAFRELTERPLDDKPAEGEAPVAALEFAADGMDLVVPGGMVFIAGGGLIDADGEEGRPFESLVLNSNWRGGDEGLAALRDLPDVTMVSIQGAKLGDAALKHIAALPRLANVSIRGTVFSVAALRELHKVKPSTYLFCQGEAMVGIHADTGGSCVLTSVYGGSGAADAGLREGDKIVAIDGVEIRDFSELTISVYGHKVGEKLKIEYERDGQRQAAEVELRPRSVLEP